jgi:hypothetical protein
MTTYKYFDGSIADTKKRGTAYATPGDNNQIVIRRGHVDTTKQTLTAATPDIAQVIPLKKNEIVLGVWVRVASKETTANAEFSIGFDAVNNQFLDGVVATTNNTSAMDWVPVVCANNSSHITLVPSNSVDLDTGIIEVGAFITVANDEDGDLPDPSYGYELS